MSLAAKSFSRWRQLVFGSALFAIGVCAAAEYWSIEHLGQVAAAFRHGDLAFALATDDMRDDVLQLRRYEKDVLLNVGAPEMVHGYQGKWEDALLHLRFDLVRARRSAPADLDPRLQEIVDSIAAYRAAFIQLCDGVRSGRLATAQQANLDANRFKEWARSAEKVLTEISESALSRTRTLDPALLAQRWALAICLTTFLALAGLLASGLPRLQPAGGLHPTQS